VGTPMLVVSRQNFDSGGTPVEFGRTWFRGDRVTLVTRLASRQG
jgi:DNA-binding GntR family transcriptional regulator